MTRSMSLLTLAAAAVASLSALSSTSAEANGVRLNFGGPLPSFVARETPGYGGGSSSHAYAKKAPSKPAYHAARQQKPEKPAAKVAARPSKPERQLARAEPHKAKPEHSDRQVVVKAERKINRPAAHESKVAALATDTATDFSTPVTGTRSLNAGSLPAMESIAAAEVVPAETITAYEAPEATETASITANGSNAKTPEVAVKSGPEECKKFIPSIGVTVTVGCSK